MQDLIALADDQDHARNFRGGHRVADRLVRRLHPGRRLCERRHGRGEEKQRDDDQAGATAHAL